MSCCVSAMLHGAGGEGAWVASVASYGGDVCWRGVSCVLPPPVNGIGRLQEADWAVQRVDALGSSRVVSVSLCSFYAPV